MKKILISLIPLIFLTGCYNYRELNELAIVSAIEIDKIDDEFHVTTQIVNPTNQNKAASTNQTAFIIYESTGKTLQEAFRNVIKQSSRKIYGMHLQLLLLSENIAKEDVKSMLDFFFRNVEVRKEFYIAVDKTGSNNNLLKVLTPITTISSKSIYDSLESNNKFIGISNLVTFNDLMDTYLDPHKELVLPTINVEGDINKGEESENIETSNQYANILIDNMAIFKDEKLLGYLNKEESLTVNILKGDVKDTLITYECSPNKYATFEISISKNDVKVNTKNLKVNVNIEGTGYIAEYGCKGDLTKEKEINKINQKLNEELKKMMKESISSINKYNSDVYNIRSIIYKNNPKFYSKIEDSYYEDVFNKLTFDIKTNINLQGKGNILGGTYENMEN